MFSSSYPFAVIVAPIAGLFSFWVLLCMLICAFTTRLFKLLPPKFPFKENLKVDMNEKSVFSKTVDAYNIAVSEIKITGDIAYYGQLLGLKIDTFKVITEDGFVLILHHLYKSSASAESDIWSSKKPVLFIHGLFCSSETYLTGGRKSLAYHMVDSNFDVWLGNNRGGFNPKHSRLSNYDPQMWNWDITEMAKYDLPALLSFVKSHNNHVSSKVSVIAHSQGTAECVFAMLKQNDNRCMEYMEKCVLLAPAIYGGTMLQDKWFLKLMRHTPDIIYKLVFGVNGFMPIMTLSRNIGHKTALFSHAAYTMLNYLAGWDDSLWNREVRQLHLLFAPVCISNKLIRWWLRPETEAGFATGKSIISEEGQWFDKRCPELFVVIGGQDKLVNGELLVQRLKNVETDLDGRWDYLVVDLYSHLDLIFADDVLRKVGEPVVNFLKN